MSADNTAEARPLNTLQGWSERRAALLTGAAGDALAQGRQAAAARPKAAPAPKEQQPRAGGTRSDAAMEAAPPLGKQVKDTIDMLVAADGHPVSLGEVAAAFPLYDLSPRSALRSALVDSGKVEFTEKGLVYKSEHGIRNRDELLHFIRSNPDGVSSGRIKDAYRMVLEDAEAMRVQGQVWKFHNLETGDDTYFPVDERFRVTIPKDVVDEYLRVKLPTDPAELQQALARLGCRSALASVDRKRLALPEAKKERAKRQRKVDLSRVTNVHMPELFTGAQPTNIDTK